KASFGGTVKLSTLDGSNGFKLNGEAMGNGVGASVTGAGDVNGDGFADVLIGAGDTAPNGAAYIVFGKASGFGAALNLSALDGPSGFKVRGEASGDLAGASVSAAGDVNHDGF